MAVEKKGWDAWKARDAAGLEAVTTVDITTVNPIGTVAAGRNATMRAWIEPKCEIESAAPSDGVGSSVSESVAILTYRGVADATCDGQPLGPVWGTTIFLKDGNVWKAAFIFSTPA